jgi:uncharacterized phage infection (PIP) family protein YhgE
MNGGTHIRAVGPGSGAEARPDEDAQAQEPLALEDEWVEDWEAPAPARQIARAIPALAVLAVAGWTGFFAWAWRAPMLAGAGPQAWSAWVVQWAVPVLLVVALWLLAMRSSRREAGRFADVAQALSRESALLETRLSVVNRELSLAREFLAAQTRELESFGRVAAGRLSEHADKLQLLVRDNGAQVEAIHGVSASAVENMDRLRDGLPVIANSARDVSNQIGNAGMTAHAQLAELVAGFGRLNEFGQASERQVAALRTKVEAALAAFEAQAAQLDTVAGARFATLREKSEAFRAELDGREVEALAAIRHRADRLREELASAGAVLDGQEEEALKSLQARVAGLRDGAGVVGRSLAEGERGALAAWQERVDALKADLTAAIAEVERIDAVALASANARLAELRDEAARVDAAIIERQQRFETAMRERREQAAGEEIARVEDTTRMLHDLDAGIARRRDAHLEQTRAMTEHAEAIEAKLSELTARLAEAAEQGRSVDGSLAEGIGTLSARLAESRAALDGTDRAVAELTEASVRLLELIQAGSQHTRTELPAALGTAESKLAEFERRGGDLKLMLDAAGERSRELSDYVLAANAEADRGMGAVEALHQRLAKHNADHAATLGDLRASLSELSAQSEAAARRAQGELQTAITALEAAARDAVTSLDDAGGTHVRALAERIGEETAGAIENAVRTRAAEAIAALEAAAAHTTGVGRDAAIQLRDQLAKVNELAGNLESRIAHARQRAEEQIDNDFSRRMALITESLNSNAIDIAKALSSDVTDTAWASYLRGDRGIFTRRAVRLLDNTEARAVAEIYDTDGDFREHVSRYIHDFEAMLRAMLSTRDGHALGVTLLSSDMGKLYVALAQAIERLRE